MTTLGAAFSTVSSATCVEWAHQLVRNLRLPDIRLVGRARAVLTAWAMRPGAALAKACPTPSEAKAAYNFIANPRVSVEALQQAVYGHDGDLCTAHPRVFVAQDTTTLTYGQRADIDGLGPVTTSRAQGLLVHTSLAISEDGVPLGLLDQQIWTRPPQKRSDHKTRPIEDKESHKWLLGVQAALARLPQDTHPVFIFDSEGDIHEVFARATELGVGLVVRATHDRRIKEPERHLIQAVRGAPLALTYPLTVPRRQGERPSRETTMALRYTTVTLDPRIDKYPHREPVGLSVVLVTEQTPQDGTKPLEWCLVTTDLLPDAQAAQQIARLYALRWRVEEFHLALKSGCRMEAHQFDSKGRIEKAVVLLSAVAVFLLRLTHWARQEPEAPATRIMDEQSEGVLRSWAQTVQGRPSPGPLTLAEAVALIGRMGGHMGRKCDGPVGIRTLWRGWLDFQNLLLGARIASSVNYGEG